VTDLLSTIWLEDSDPLRLNLQEWELLLSQAARGSLLTRLSRLLMDRGGMSQVPSEVAEQLAGPSVLAARQQIEVIDEVERIRNAASTCADTIVLLKGAAYLVAGLPPYRGRLFSDIDLMVRRDQIATVESALLGAGWISQERDAYNERYYRRWMHEIPPLFHVMRASAIDLHHTIAPPTSRFRVDAHLLYDHLVPTRFANVFTLGPADMVLHSAVHLLQEGEFDRGLRDLLDLQDLLMHFSQSEGFWEALQARAHALGLQEPLCFALFHVKRLFGYCVPESCVALALEVDKWQSSHKFFNWCLELALKPDHPSCNTSFSAFARWALYVRSHKIRMPVYLLIPHLLRKSWMNVFKRDEMKELAKENARMTDAIKEAV
jgi:hypothetical protein